MILPSRRFWAMLAAVVATLAVSRLASAVAPRAVPHTVPTVDSLVQVVRAATQPLRDTAAARAAGFAPLERDGLRDLTPVQGQHWINRARMRHNRVDLSSPPVLMFAPIGGGMQLVGVAFAERVGATASMPATLGGVPAGWHAHVPCIGGALGASLPPSAEGCRAQGGMPGRRKIAMVHVWLDVPSPDGVFAHSNPALPFLAAGIPVPPFHDADAAMQETMLALGDAHGMQLLVARLTARDATTADRQRIAEARAAVREKADAYAAAARDAGGAPVPEEQEQLLAAWQHARVAYLNALPPMRAAILERQWRAVTTSAHGADHADGHAAHH